jgi:hypothetical protein
MPANTITTVTQIRRRADVDPMCRSANRFLMVRFINADLIGRASLDVHRSIVLYDADRVFMAAVPFLPDSAVLQRLYDEAGVRHWSRGVV